MGGPLDILSEIEQDSQRPEKGGCVVCSWIKSRSDEIPVWNSAMENKANHSRAILRAMKKRGAKFEYSSIIRHRKNHVGN